MESRRVGDTDEIVITGGLRLVDEALDLDVRADRAVVTLDRAAVGRVLRGLDSGSGLPRREPVRPSDRRGITEEVLRRRIGDFLAAIRGEGRALTDAPVDLATFRSLHLEGDVAIVRSGIEVLRASQLTWSLTDDRMVLRDLVLRLVDGRDGLAAPLVTVRAPELVRQEGRFVGRGVSVTTSRAGQPNFEVLGDEIELIERGDEFEIRSRGNTLVVGSRRVLPIPDQSWFTGDPFNLLIKGASAGYNSREGVDVEVVLGDSWNELGGSIHSALTGRAREEFRGDWRLGVGYIEKRGTPLRPELTYSADGLYEGRTRGFVMDDRGEDFRAVTRNLDGTPTAVDGRHLVMSENRVHLGEHTTFDVQVFDASDAGVYSEYYVRDHIEGERPETVLHLRDFRENRLATATGRWNLTDFAYGDARQLTPMFVEEEPRLTYDWFSQSLADLPGDGSLLITSSSEVVRLRADYDPRAGMLPEQETWRLDQEIELAAPFQVGVLRVRPFASGRFTWYEDTVSGDSDGRSALGAGVEVGTRIAKTFTWLDDDGTARALRHVLSPTIRYEDRFQVDGDPSDYFQLDPLDALDERANLRLGLLQRLQTRTPEGQNGEGTPRELLWFDLAQNIATDPNRDNDGDVLGLLEFETILRPLPRWSETNWVEFVVEGEHDWNRHELRTWNNFVRLRTDDVTWLAEYRSDYTQAGQVGLGARFPVRQRWDIAARSRYDLETSDFVDYTVRLARDDLDWRVALVTRYDNLTDQTSFQIQFEPRFGGLTTRRAGYRVGGADFAANDNTAF